MSLLITMLPLYLLGNLHCMGMCGPLVLMLGQHQYRAFYFLGRTLSFTLAGLLAGALGSVLQIALKSYHIPAIASFLFGSFIILLGIYSFLGWHYPGYQQVAKRLNQVNGRLSLLILKDQPLPTFLFGFFTIALPCGQTLIVYSACALAGETMTGLINGFAFAALTSPSLLFAMQMHRLVGRAKRYYHAVIGLLALCVGTLALCRGFAELELIPHWTLNPETSPLYHLVVY